MSNVMHCKKCDKPYVRENGHACMGPDLESVTANVPCNGCTLCCHNDAIRLLPHEDPTQYQTESHPAFPGSLMLAHKPNGDCVYLGDDGCENYENRPQLCRDMDCRNIASALTYTQARKLAGRKGFAVAFPMGVWKRGRELLNSKN